MCANLNVHPASLRNLQDELERFSLDHDLHCLLKKVHFKIEECDFGARAIPASNTISLNPNLFNGSNPTSEAIESALFELINLSKKEEFQSLVDRIDWLNPEEFVEEYERIEYRTAKICKKILIKQIPLENYDDYPLIYTTEHFQLHYLLQQLKGHSQKIYDTYKNRLAVHEPYRGTLDLPGEKESAILTELINLKIGSEQTSTTFGKSAKSNYQRLKTALLSNPKYNHLRSHIKQIEEASKKY